MRLAVPKEVREGETRVAATPESVKKFKGLGLDVVVEAGAGQGAKISDADYTAAGAMIAPDALLRATERLRMAVTGEVATMPGHRDYLMREAARLAEAA